MNIRPLLLFVILQVSVATATWYILRSTQPVAQAMSSNLSSMAREDLTNFDGTDSAKPIYLALDGLIYDVSAGREYYEPGGSYHMLAGTDASTLLHIAGAGIIQKKYTVVARLSQ